jgi:hypothetical protein
MDLLAVCAPQHYGFQYGFSTCNHTLGLLLVLAAWSLLFLAFVRGSYLLAFFFPVYFVMFMQGMSGLNAWGGG